MHLRCVSTLLMTALCGCADACNEPAFACSVDGDCAHGSICRDGVCARAAAEGEGVGGEGEGVGGEGEGLGGEGEGAAGEGEGAAGEGEGAAGEGEGAGTDACGDGVLGSAEQCDDGNASDRDGCSSVCTRWFDAASPTRIPLAIANPAGADVADVPVLVRMPDATAASASLGDTACFVDDDDATVLPFELDDDDGSETAVFVRVPLVPGAPAERVIHLYTGLPAGQACGVDATAVWSGRYDAVFHMEPALVDSTSNTDNLANHGTSDTAGVVGRARQTTAPNDVDDVAPSTVLRNHGDLTIEAFVNPSQLNNSSYPNTMVYFAGDSVEVSSTNTLYYFGVQADGSLGHYWEHDQGVDSTLYLSNAGVVRTGIWQHVVMVRDATAQRVSFFVDGAAVGSSASTEAIQGGDGSWLTLLGNTFDSSRGLDGALDEVRISSSVESPAYIALQCKSMTRPGIVRIGAVESAP